MDHLLTLKHKSDPLSNMPNTDGMKKSKPGGVSSWNLSTNAMLVEVANKCNTCGICSLSATMC